MDDAPPIVPTVWVDKQKKYPGVFRALRLDVFDYARFSDSQLSRRLCAGYLKCAQDPTLQDAYLSLWDEWDQHRSLIPIDVSVPEYPVSRRNLRRGLVFLYTCEVERLPGWIHHPYRYGWRLPYYENVVDEIMFVNRAVAAFDVECSSGVWTCIRHIQLVFQNYMDYSTHIQPSPHHILVTRMYHTFLQLVLEKSQAPLSLELLHDGKTARQRLGTSPLSLQQACNYTFYAQQAHLQSVYESCLRHLQRTHITPRFHASHAWHESRKRTWTERVTQLVKHGSNQNDVSATGSCLPTLTRISSCESNGDDSPSSETQTKSHSQAADQGSLAPKREEAETPHDATSSCFTPLYYWEHPTFVTGKDAPYGLVGHSTI